MSSAKFPQSAPPVHIPQSVAEIGTDSLRTGDMLVELRKKALHPESSWSYTLVVRGRGDRSLIGMAKGWEYVWHAVYGPGKMAGRHTSISPSRLVRMHRVGNVTQMPFTIQYPEPSDG